MRYLTNFLFLSVFSCLTSFAQTPRADLMSDMENNLLQIRQMAGTDSLLSRLMNDAGIKEDTIYAFMYVPGSCPRCEAGIKPFRNMLKKRGKKFTLISVFKDGAVSDYFNKLKGYKADYYINDTAIVSKNIFSFNNNPFQGKIILKITRSGRMITGGNYTALNTNFVDQIIARTEPMEYHDFGSPTGDEEEMAAERPKGKTLKVKDTYRLEMSGKPLCRNNNSPVWQNGICFFGDDVLNSVSVFDEDREAKKLLLRETVVAEDSYKKRFIEIEDSMLQVCERMGGVFYIYCNSNVYDDDNIAFSYSLPKIVYMDSLKQELGAFNQACIIKKPRNEDGQVEVYPINARLFKDNYFYKHFQFSVADGRVFLGCQHMTWPMDFRKEQYCGIPDMDPFAADYYRQKHPYIAAFDVKTGELIRRFGNLPAFAEKTRTGYSFVQNCSSTYKDEIAYTDCFSGRVTVGRTDNPESDCEEYTVFDLNLESLPEPDSTRFYTYEYNHTYRKYFNRQIRDIRFNDRELCCIVSYGACGSDVQHYTMVRVNRKTRKREEFMIPQTPDLFSTGLRVDGDTIRAFQIVKAKDGEKALLY